MLALTPKQIVKIKGKGIVIDEFQKWRKLLIIQSKRVNHYLNITASDNGKK